MARQTISVLVLVKAAPVLTSGAEELMCVAGMRLDGPPEWVRLYPVPFRDLAEGAKFTKYQRIEVDVVRPTNDRRTESWTPLSGSIKLGERLTTSRGRWDRRRELVEQLGERTVCGLRDAAAEVGQDAPSLGLVRPATTPELVIEERDQADLDEWERRAAEWAASPSLFDDPDEARHPLEAIPWRFKYRFRCLDEGCNGHEPSIIDWEVMQLYRNVADRDDWRDAMRQKFVDQMFAPDRDTALFVGNMHRHPQNFLVLGVFWPPAGAMQTSLV